MCAARNAFGACFLHVKRTTTSLSTTNTLDNPSSDNSNLILDKHCNKHKNMTGPLPPPPSSAQEFRDAARASAPPDLPPITQPSQVAEQAAAAAQTVPPATDLHQQSLYQSAFSAICGYATAGQYDELVRFAEECDLQVCRIYLLLIVRQEAHDHP